jgi:peptidoglycan/LPS O-acetylase OafA/YrhL
LTSQADADWSRQEIPALTGLRGVAALWVFFYHALLFSHRVGSNAQVPTSWLGGAGYLGVDLFFVLSGFVLMHRYGVANLHVDIRRFGAFLWKRLARIYPVHLVGLALVLVLQIVLGIADLRFLPEERLSLEGLLASLALVHAWSFPVERTWNTVSWSISCEWAAYLAFPWIALASSVVRSRWLMLLLLFSIYACLALLVWEGPYRGTMAYGMARIAAGFSAGVLLHRLWEIRNHERRSGFDRLAAVSLAALILGGNALATLWGTPVTLATMPILACAVIYGIAAGSGVTCRLLCTRTAQWAGRLSYSFYMVNYLVLSAVAVLVRGTGLLDGAAPGLLAIGGILAVVVAMAAMIHRTCELPARKVMLALLQSRGLWRSSQSAAIR